MSSVDRCYPKHWIESAKRSVNRSVVLLVSSEGRNYNMACGLPHILQAFVNRG